MKVLVTGSAGMLAKDLIPHLTELGHDVVAPPEEELDILDRGIIQTTVDRLGPDIIVNCAAYTNVDGAETEEHQAFMINGFAVQNLCLVCQQRDIPLVHFSTDYVFDGTSERPYSIYDAPGPSSVYGRSKLLGERYVLWLLTKFYMVRTAWLFGHNGRNFIETMLELGQSRKQLSVVNDQKGCPTWTRHLARAVAGLIETGRFGIYHVTNSEPTTWYDFAREIFRMANMDVEVLPVSTDQFPRPAKRPHNSVLDPFPLPQVLGWEMPSWKEALKEYMQLRQRRN